jgi:hypothetical protein
VSPQTNRKKRKAAPTGSLEAIDWLSTMEAAAAEDDSNRERIDANNEFAAQLAMDRLQSFVLCKNGCRCEPEEGEGCAAKGLRQCDVCARVLKTVCKLKSCVEARELAVQIAEDSSDNDDEELELNEDESGSS